MCQKSTIEIDIRGKIPRFLYWHFIYFYTEKLTWRKTNYLWRFININVYTFSPFWNAQDTSHNFSTLSYGYFSYLLQCKIPADFLFLVLYWNEAEEGVFQNRKSRHFILVDGHSFGIKVFMIIEILSKKWRKQKLGTECNIYLHWTFFPSICK